MYLPDAGHAAAMIDDVAIGSHADVLDAVSSSHVALALWRRPSPATAMTLNLDKVDDLSFMLASGADHAPTDIATAHLADGGYTPEAAIKLGSDIAMLAALQQRLTQASAIKVRLDVIEDDACRRFHADYVTLRMLCTYLGAGTQWCRAAAPDMIYELRPGTVGVFKGRLAMEEPKVLHRSPPACSGRTSRLLLVLDPA